MCWIRLLKEAVARGASDIHFPPFLRMSEVTPPEELK